MSTQTIAGQALLSGAFEPATVSVEDGLIVDVALGADRHADIRARGWIVPGFIDLQINGGMGFDFTTDSATSPMVAERLPSTGVTAFLPTIISAPDARYPRLLDDFARVKNDVQGAEILGVHLEGPYLSPARAGAHNRDHLRAPRLPEAIEFFASPLIRIVTLAPELPNALELIHLLRARGVVVSAGHSDATLAQAQAAFQAGVRWGTHLYNAMPPLSPRAPGLVGAFLSSDVPCGLIADGIHVDPAAVRIALRAKGRDGITLVTDAMAAMGLGHGQYQLGDHAVRVDASGARLADGTSAGTLAGSVLPLDQAVRNMMTFTGCSLADAVTMASTTPARVLGLEKKGRLRAGGDADLVLLDESLQVELTMVHGRILYER